MANKEETYFVVYLDDTDGDPKIAHWSGEDIRKYVKLFGGYQGDLAIFEGNLIKGFDSKIDMSKL